MSDMKFRIVVKPYGGVWNKWIAAIESRDPESGLQLWRQVKVLYARTSDGAERKAIRAWEKVQKREDFTAAQTRTIDLG